MLETLTQLAKTHLGPLQQHQALKAVLVINQNGQILVQIGDIEDAQSIGALVNGQWLAGRELHAMVTGDVAKRSTFSFETSDSGVAAFGIEYGGETFQVSGVYQSVNAPALIRRHLQQATLKLENALNATQSSKESASKELLFGDISDNEIDDLFGGQ